MENLLFSVQGRVNRAKYWLVALAIVVVEVILFAAILGGAAVSGDPEQIAAAIGPFAGRHTIDFGALAQGGLFLLEGPTGSGKSTVIDAIVFALYGKVASAEASEDRLRSAYAADDVESMVDLVFEVPSGLYRVRRTPAYQRAKRRGTGTTPAQASVKLWRLPADAQPEYDVVLVDAGDLALGGELLSLARTVDAIIVVVEAGKTRKKELTQAVSAIGAAGGNVAGLVLFRRKPLLPAWLERWIG